MHIEYTGSVNRTTLYLQANPGVTPNAVASAIKANVTAGKVKSSERISPDLLLYLILI
jgi:hypothetical protein